MQKTYRLGAGAVVFNREGKVWVGARAKMKDDHWQFAQGGIEVGESPLQAAKRELLEETNMSSVKLVCKYPGLLRYDFPADILEKQRQLGRTNIGQEQHWFLFFFDGDDSEIDLNAHPDEIEFKKYKWVELQEAAREVVEFKRPIYQCLADCFCAQIVAFIKGI